MNNTEAKHSLHLYLNDDENELLENKFRLSKAKSKSQFVRNLIVDGPKGGSFQALTKLEASMMPDTRLMMG